MVKKIWLPALLLCAVWSGQAVADVRLTIRADKKTMALGEPLMVELKAEDVREPLSSISLDKLKQDFNVYGISSNVQTQSKKGRINRPFLLAAELRAGPLVLRRGVLGYVLGHGLGGGLLGARADVEGQPPRRERGQVNLRAQRDDDRRLDGGQPRGARLPATVARKAAQRVRG